MLSLMYVITLAAANISGVQFSITRQATPRRLFMEGPGAARGVEAYDVHGATGGDSTAATNVPQYDPRGNVALHEDGGIQYVVNVGIGTPWQTMRLILDTGSSDMLVAGSTYACHKGSKSKNCALHRVYRESASSSYKQDSGGAPLQMHEKYQAGFVDGVAASDRVRIGGYDTQWVHFGVLRSESKAVEFSAADGVLGFAFVGLSKITSPPLFAQLVRERADALGGEHNMFSIFIAPGLSATGSKLILGGYDLSLAGSGAVWHYTPVIKLSGYDEYTYWAFRVTSMRLKWADGVAMDVCHGKSGCKAIVDSGMWGIGVPKRYFKRFVDMVTDNHDDCRFVNGGTTVYCGHCYLTKFPTLYFGAPPDNTFALKPGDYVMNEHSHNAQRGYTHREGDRCWLMFDTADKAGNNEVFVLGDTFLSTYYTLFDAGNMRIGLACDATDTCIGGQHATHVMGHVSEGLHRSRVHNALQVGVMFGFSAFCFYIFWLGEKRRDGTWDPETEAFGAGTSRGTGYRGIAAGSSTGGWRYESVEEPGGIVLNDRSSVSHTAIGAVPSTPSHSVIGVDSDSIALSGYQDAAGGGGGYSFPSSPPPEL